VVKRVSGVDFKVEHAGRRKGDPACIVAANERVCTALGWRPRFDDLSLIVTHALAWERRLMERFQRGENHDRNHAEIA
jgi:UDP-glucose 4-epimerase